MARKITKGIFIVLAIFAMESHLLSQRTVRFNKLSKEQIRAQIKPLLLDRNTFKITPIEKEIKGKAGRWGLKQNGAANVTNNNTGKVTDTGISAVSPSEAQKALDFHNAARKEVGVPPLKWSTVLAKFAQEWAEHLAKTGDFSHRPYSGSWAQKYGENIFYGYGTVYTVLDASESWYSEKKDFINVPLNESNWSVAGHYSQMVWRNTETVGIGIAKSKDGSYIIVANYNIPGNWIGEKAY